MVKITDRSIMEKKCGTIRGMDALKAAGLGGNHPEIVEPLAEVLAKPFPQFFSASLDKGWLPAS